MKKQIFNQLQIEIDKAKLIVKKYKKEKKLFLAYLIEDEIKLAEHALSTNNCIKVQRWFTKMQCINELEFV